MLTREVRLILEGCLQLDLNLKLPRVLVTASLSCVSTCPSWPMLEENIESTKSRLPQAWLASYLVTLARVSLVPTIYNLKRIYLIQLVEISLKHRSVSVTRCQISWFYHDRRRTQRFRLFAKVYQKILLIRRISVYRRESFDLHDSHNDCCYLV